MSININLFESWIDNERNFHEDVLGGSARAFPATAGRLSAVQKLAPSWTVEAILAEHRAEVVAWLQTLDGQMKAAQVSTNAARDLYAAGTTLYLRKVAFLEPLRRDFAASLRLPLPYVECSLFCNQPGATTRMHFDTVDTLTVQVTGSKRWRVAPNRHAPSPTQYWASCDPLKHELRMYAHEPFPTAMPEDSVSALLEPGGMLYIPMGDWHETASDEESISIHIHLQRYSWADAVLSTLRARLVRDEAWRKTAYGLLAPTRAGRSWGASSALEALRAAVAELHVDDIKRPAPLVSSSDAKVTRRARTAVGVDDVDNGDKPARVTFSVDEHGWERTTSVEMAPEYRAATLLLAKSPVPLSEAEIAERVPGLDVNEVRKLKQVLFDVGYIRNA